MQKFAFKLAALLKYREHQRNLCRQSLAEAIAEDQALLAERKNLESTRATQLEEMRELTGARVVNIDRSAARRYYASQLTIDISVLESHRAQVAQKIAERRQSLVLADQKVKALEKLSQKQFEDYLSEQERRAGRDLEESWMAAHLLELNNS